jgi:CheY-like chemotaxis protein
VNGSRVLVVENDLNKAKQLIAYIKEIIPGVEVQERNSYQSGLKSALLEEFSIIVLDMTLPTFDEKGTESGGRERRYGGSQVLSQLERKGNKTPVIVVTQFEKFGEGAELITLDELRSQLCERYSSFYKGTVFYQAADARWKVDLKRLIAKCVALS